MDDVPDPAAGTVVGVARRGEVYARALWHGVGGVLLRSGDGERVYVHRRSATKLVRASSGVAVRARRAGAGAALVRRVLGVVRALPSTG